MQVYSLLKNNKTKFILGASSLARLLLGIGMGVWFNSGEQYDDALLARYALAGFMKDGKDALLKLRGYSMFLEFVHQIHIPYPVVLSLIWIALAFYAKYVFKKISKKSWVSWFMYFYVLFFPTAFEYLMGTRLYRNSILIPCYLLLFFLMFDTLIEMSYGKLLGLGLTLGCTYLVKEDGMWLVAVLLFYTIVLLIRYVRKEKVLLTICACCIPLSSFFVTKQAYLQVNENIYGVRYLETRTSGEFGEFVNRVYKIQSKNRNYVVWAPKDAIQKAFQASPTLKKNTDLWENIQTSNWVGNDLDTNPIRGDFLTWVLRDALQEANMWTSEKEVNAYFAKVNKELDAAFEKGTLKKDDKIQLVSSAGGKSIQEILDLRVYMYLSYKGTIFLSGYRPGGAQSDVAKKNLSKSISEYVYIPYVYTVKSKTYDVPNTITKILFMMYRIVNVFLLAIVMLVSLLWIVDFFKHIKRLRSIQRRCFQGLAMFFMMGLSFVYVFSISWFTSFLTLNAESQYWQNFYAIGLPAMFVFVFGFGLVLFDAYIVRAVVQSRQKI